MVGGFTALFCNSRRWSIVMYYLHRRQFMPISIERAWEFLGTPVNLDRITPPDVHFQIIGSWPGHFYAGLIVRYRVTPLLGIPVRWASEITQVREPTYFVDHQIEGPYRYWHHQHLLVEVPGGVCMDDVVHYRIPLWPLTRPMHHLLIRPKLESIFDFRRDTLVELFGAFPPEGLAAAEAAAVANAITPPPGVAGVSRPTA